MLQAVNDSPITRGDAVVVQIVEDAQRTVRAYRRLGRVTDWSCDTTSEEPAPGPGVQGRAHGSGRGGGGWVPAPEDDSNCLASIECEGEGVGLE